MRSTLKLRAIAVAPLFFTGLHVTYAQPASTVAVSSPSTPDASTQSRGSLYEPNDKEREFVDLINAERKSRGLTLLQIDPLLTRIARAHSREMAEKNYFDHYSPTPGLATPMARYIATMKTAGMTAPVFAIVGENIYYCSLLNAKYNVEHAHAALMNSPHHRANILEPRYQKIGVGTYQDSAGEIWVSEEFLRDTKEYAPKPLASNPSDGSSTVAADPSE